MHERARVLTCALLVVFSLGASTVVSAQTGDPQALQQEIAQLRQELAEVQKQYGERLNALEARLGTVAVATPPVAEPQVQEAAQPPTVVIRPSCALV